MKNKHLSGNLFTGKPLQIRETSLSAMIAEYLDNRNIYNDRLNCLSVESKFGTWIQGCKKGTPDRFAIIRGRVIFIEVKQMGKKPSDVQKERQAELEKHGAVIINADSFRSFTEKFSEIRTQIETGESLYQ